MKILAILFVVLLAGCDGSVNGFELQAIAKQCGGVDKIHSLWSDVYDTNAYCNDGSRAGDWSKSK